MLYALIGIPVMCLYMANIGGILASSFKFLYTKLCRCDTEPADLPKKATLPSIKEDALSYLEEEVGSQRGSQSSTGKTSREDSLVSGKGGSRTNRLRNIVHFGMKKVEEDGVGGQGEVEAGATPLPPYSELGKQEEESGQSGAGKLFRKLTTKPVKKKEEKEDVVEFKLVEDLRLVTIPITTCLLILISYIIFGAVLFSAWEGWNFLDGAYFCFISLMTIGFGDFVPGNSYIYNVAENVTEEVSSYR